MKERITEYMSGGLSGPELMDHDKLSRLLIDAREYIEFLEKRLEHSTEMHEHTMEMLYTLIGKLK